MATICVHHVTACLEGVRRSGGDEKAILAGLGINPAILEGAEQRVHADLVARLFKQVQITLNDEFMGFTRHPCKVGVFSLMCQLVSTCSTLEELLNKGAHCYNLITNDTQMSLSRSAETATYSIHLAEPGLDVEHFLAEFLLVTWHRFASWFIGKPIPLQETHFSFSPPPHHDELKVMFPGKHRFNCASNRLLFAAEYLAKPLVRSNQELSLFMQNAPADVMTIPGSDSTLEAQVERLILGKSTDKLVFPTVHELADDLDISAQTLHRKLKKSGSSYQAIKDNLRRNLAIKKLVDEQLSIDEVSDIVGFAEPRSFTRAFRQWTGMTPRAYKKTGKLPTGL